ncbi:hypothetical protein Pla123a_15690 [Posidoniimonas polymericola]|uniref:O-Antigen ligase n=1 Tax=Posidoniimonas polymericola TaxID=2528002 RepID=A0A5C5YSK3_9BACT|nr:hypothetical protein [Posidoniimonas polymericola]TWT77773.1 hypothetical protein Pla123a_15690 [Posidoniimonas polymericola]
MLLLLYASKVAWYDLRIVFESLRGDAFRQILGLYGLLMLPFLAAALTYGARQFFNRWTLLLFAGVSVYGIALNVVWGVKVPVYVAQDLYKLAFIPAAYLMVVNFRPDSCDTMLRYLSRAVVAFLVIKILVTLLYYHGSFGLYYGGVLDLYPFCYYAAKHFDRGSKPTTGLMAIASLLLAAMGQKRTVLLAAIAVIVYLLGANWRKLVRSIATYAALAAAIVIGICFRAPLEDFISQHFKRVIQLNEVTSFDEDMPRLAEVMVVLDELDSHGPWAKYFGLGHGAAFENAAIDVHGEELTHSVHFTPAAMLLRYGAVGIVFYGAIAVAILAPRKHHGSAWVSRSDLMVVRCYGVVAVLGSFAIYGLVDDMVTGAMLGVCSMNRPHNRSSRQRRRYAQSPIRLKAKSVASASTTLSPPLVA